MSFQDKKLFEIELIPGEEYAIDRPKKVHNRVRNKAFNTRFTAEEFEMITEKQIESKLTRSDFFSLWREKNQFT